MPEKQTPAARYPTRKLKVDPWSAACPSRAIIELLSGNWVFLIVPLLRRGPLRNGDLMRSVAGISQKMLTQTLRDLEARGLVYRRDHGEVPPRVEYGLSPLGRSLAQILTVLDEWVIRRYDALSAVADLRRSNGRQ
jgi:DNA-binding HxlR family transcriptional regulator